MGPEGLLPHSQKLVTFPDLSHIIPCPIPIPEDPLILSSNLTLVFQVASLPQVFPTKNLYEILLSTIRAT